MSLIKKKYNQYTADVPVGTDIIIFGDPVTGELNKVTISDLLSASGITISDDAYNSVSWNASTIAPSQNAVRDKFESIVIPTVSDVAYDATTWNANTDAPSKNAIRDKFESLPVTASGTYTPTLTGQSNVASSTVYDLIYTRVGSIVTVSGLVGINPTLAANEETQLLISLPIATTNTDLGKSGGVGFTQANGATTMMGASIIIANIGGVKALFDFVSVDVNDRLWSFTFSYLVA